jgi:hypothetical protein
VFCLEEGFVVSVGVVSRQSRGDTLFDTAVMNSERKMSVQRPLLSRCVWIIDSQFNYSGTCVASKCPLI